jgi:hypothetical protein
MFLQTNAGVVSDRVEFARPEIRRANFEMQVVPLPGPGHISEVQRSFTTTITTTSALGKK